MRVSPLRTYEGQIKTFLSLLVLFLAAAILLDVHLLVVARDAIQDEVGSRLALQADLVRADLERDQMLRGLRGEGGEVPYIPPTLLARLARQKGMIAIEEGGARVTGRGRVWAKRWGNELWGDDPRLKANMARQKSLSRVRLRRPVRRL